MKKLLQKAGILALALSLTGCFKMRISVDVKSDATYTGTYTMLMSESMLTMGGQSVDAALETMIAEQKESTPDVEIEPVKEGEGENAYAGICVHQIPDDSVKVTKNDNIITVEVPIKELQGEIEESVEEETMGIDMSAIKEYGAEALITINMPAAPEANAGTIEGNKVTLDLLETQTVDTLIITCKYGLSQAAKIGIGVACGLAAVLILVMILKKKKN